VNAPAQGLSGDDIILARALTDGRDAGMHRSRSGWYGSGNVPIRSQVVRGRIWKRKQGHRSRKPPRIWGGRQLREDI